MPRLPDEIWIQILDYLEPESVLNCQRVSRRMLKVARDSSIWRSKCFERAQSAVHVFSSDASPDSLSDYFNVLSLGGSGVSAGPGPGHPMSRRAKAIVKWDCSDAAEKIDWYSEYVARHAPLFMEWVHHPKDSEIRSMAFLQQEEKILSAMEDGSLRIWDVQAASNGRRRLKESGQSQRSLLFADLSSTSGPPAPKRQPSVGTAIDSTVVDTFRDMAYIAVGDVLNEVDLKTMQLVSQNKYAWNITATSQVAGPNLPLMIGTSFSLQMHDPRLSLRYHADQTDHRLDMTKEDENVVFLDNYNKSQNRAKWSEEIGSTDFPGSFSYLESMRRRSQSPRRRPEFCARVEPGPQAILHYGVNEIVVAGRMPSILFYDKRVFPKLQYSIHSGARLSSITTLPNRPHGATNATAEATLIAAGEYHGRGSLELYELPYHRPSDRKPTRPRKRSKDAARETDSANSDSADAQPAADTSSEDPGIEVSGSNARQPGRSYVYHNRQTASQAKLLSVTTQGTRVVFSDGEGGLKWVERDGRGLARRWNINSYQYTQAGGAVVGEAVARKILTFSSDQSRDEDGQTIICGDGDLLVWTGSDIGIVTTKVARADQDDLVKAFEEKMHLTDDSPSDREQEEGYARTMRMALERQADERRFLARFGRTGGW